MIDNVYIFIMYISALFAFFIFLKFISLIYVNHVIVFWHFNILLIYHWTLFI